MPEVEDSRSGLSFGWASGDSGWGVDVNANFQLLAYEGTHIRINSSASAPPANPNEADCYLVGANPTGDWSTYDENSLVVWGHSAAGGAEGWLNIQPKVGFLAWKQDSSQLFACSSVSPLTWTAIQGLTSQQEMAIGSISAMNLTEAQITALVAVINAATTDGLRIDFDNLKDKPTLASFTTATQRSNIDNALTTIHINSTLSGAGTSGSPLAVANPFTAGDKTRLDGLENTPDNRKIPTGGAAGEVLSKRTASDFDVVWGSGSTPGAGISSVTLRQTPDSGLSGAGTSTSPLYITTPFTSAEKTKLSSTSIFTSTEKTKLGGLSVETGNTLVNKINAQTTTGKINYSRIVGGPMVGTVGTVRSGEQLIDAINDATDPDKEN